MIRITLSGEICQFSSKLEIEPDLWDIKNGRVLGKNTQAMKLNALIDNMRVCLMKHVL